jgi:endonuclease/exonuclease/phosphatase (EEP) superfamily protein YafD
MSLCRVFTPAPRRLVLATSFVPFATIGYLLAALLLLVGWRLTSGRLRRVAAGLAALSLLGSVGHAALLVPLYVGSHASGRPDLVVMTSNLRLGFADMTTVGQVALAQDVDVLVLEEVTPVEAASMAALQGRFPYHAGVPAAGAYGTMVFSRYPLRDVVRLPISKGTWRMRVQAPTPFWFVGVHTAQPLSKAAAWRSDHAWLLRAVHDLPGPVVLAGDFNATLDHRPMRRLLSAGFADAARQANSGWDPTWPGAGDADGGLPFGLHLLTLDHVLTRQYSAISTRTYTIPQSDHRALVARLALD